MKAIEASAVVEKDNRLVLDEPLDMEGPQRVRLIILFPETDDIDEHAWLRAASASPALDFLKDPREDIYTVADGRPFHDEG